ncbi:hypothetical protein [Candidatus Avelusimicrobium faecicola]|uniref:hypothetical protein n=1 Tax=Candidatus Avelusimicrobium faecicola TaxID=3416205 RepID=UPI003D0D62DC
MRIKSIRRLFKKMLKDAISCKTHFMFIINTYCSDKQPACLPERITPKSLSL